MRALAFAVLRELSHERFVSGQALGERLGVSRSAISQALKEVAAQHVRIFSLSRRGYRLAEPLELLEVENIHRELGDRAHRLDIEVLDEVASTNTLLLQRMAHGLPSGKCLVAELQTGGRGRRGRSWQSVLGGSLTFSLLWRFDRGAAALGGVSLLTGLAVVRAMHTLGIPDVGVKWPNDVVARGKKLAGILIETQGDMLGPTAAVMGVGINVRLPEALQSAIDQPIIDVQSLLLRPVSRHALLAAVLREWVGLLDRFTQGGFALIREEWLACNVLQHQPILVRQGDGTSFEAVAVGIASDGALMVEVEGRTVLLNSAEISVRPAES